MYSWLHSEQRQLRLYFRRQNHQVMCFNDDLYHKPVTKDDQAIWKAWRTTFCSHSFKPPAVLNGKYGDVDIRNTFSVYL